MCKGCKLNRDEDSRKEFLEMVLFWMQDTQSFVAVEESTGRTIGVLVGRVIHLEGHTKTMSRSRVRYWVVSVSYQIVWTRSHPFNLTEVKRVHICLELFICML